MKKYVLEIGPKEYHAEVKELTAEYAKIEIDGTIYDVKLKELGRKEGIRPIISTVKPATLSVAAPVAPTVQTPVGDAEAIRAPLPGLILDVKVKEGDSVKAGQDILVMEAMKMENQVQATHDGTIGKLYVQKGDTVAEGDLLASISRSFMSTI